MNFDLFDLDLPETEKVTLKSDLFSSVIKIQALNKELEKILQLPSNKRENWIDQNTDVLEQMMQELSTDSTIVLDGISGDDQEVNLSVEYISSLRDAMNTLSSILYRNNKLLS